MTLGAADLNQLLAHVCMSLVCLFSYGWLQRLLLDGIQYVIATAVGDIFVGEPI